MQGLLLINKPKDITSFGVVARIRRLTNERRVGHTGTLDPMATGVLPVFVGKATSLSSYLLDADKSYEATVKLGILTDTLDITGKVIKETAVSTDNKTVLSVLDSFLGEQSQIPPMYSAIKKDGERLYAKARRGEAADIPPRTVTVHKIEQTSPLNSENEFSFTACVSKGTYIRSLARDIGEKLGTTATLTELERTSTGGFSISNCVSLDVLTPENIGDYLLPADRAIEHIEKVSITKNQAIRFSNGGKLDLDRIGVKEATDGKLLRVYFEETFCGLGIIENASGQLAIKCNFKAV